MKTATIDGWEFTLDAEHLTVKDPRPNDSGYERDEMAIPKAVFGRALVDLDIVQIAHVTTRDDPRLLVRKHS